MATAIQIIAGLGNPGSKYDKTRHNAGFWLLDELARRYSGHFSAEKRFSGEVCKVTIAYESVWLIKPTTFMNRSGLALRQLQDFYRIPTENILIAHDELDIPAGHIRLKQGGGHGGHNGLRDLHAHIGKEYWRLRLGIDHPGDKNQVSNYVLSTPGKDDAIAITNGIDAAADEIETIIRGDMQAAMQLLHSR